LDRTEIDAMVVPFRGLQAELAEIDENLIRNELTELELSRSLARRKEIYEAIHVVSRPVHESKIAGPGRGHYKTSADSAPVSFAWDVAAKTGMARRTVLTKVQIGKNLTAAAADLVRGTSVEDNETSLLEIARLPPAAVPAWT
jgi:ParB family transcriptional regulator, chromosome partitioning protein